MNLSLYGSVPLVKGYCAECRNNAFIIDGKLQCCDTLIEMEKIKSVKRESEGVGSRLTIRFKNKILDLQKHKCIICGVDFKANLFYRKKTRYYKVKIEYDHFIPRSFIPNNEINNIHAMCNLCNQYKGSKMFDTISDAAKYIIAKRENRGLMELYVGSEFGIIKSGWLGINA